MKRYLTILFLLLTSIAYSQNTEEWMNQGNTQTKYLLRQIAALKTYAGLLEKGYNTVKDGLNLIADIKSGDFNLHSTYFNSLRRVSPVVSKYAKIADIILQQRNIIAIHHRCRTLLKTSGNFSEMEKRYVDDVFSSLIEESVRNIELLTMLVEDNYLDLKDDERISMIDTLYEQILDKSVFAQHFSWELKLIGVQRVKESVEANKSAELYGVKLN